MGWGWAVSSDFAVCSGQGPSTAWLTIRPAQPLPPTPETAGLCRAERRLLGSPVCPGNWREETWPTRGLTPSGLTLPLTAIPHNTHLQIRCCSQQQRQSKLSKSKHRGPTTAWCS